MAEVLARHALTASGSVPVTVASAGVYGWDSSPMADGAATALRGLGITADEFRSRALTTDMVAEADLVLTMERAHRARILSVTPGAMGKTFTLREFTRLLTDGVADEPVSDVAERARRLVRLAAGQRGGHSAATPADDDVSDPYGGPAEGYHSCAALLRGTLDPMLPRLFG